jgi:HEAT repeat protein
VATTSGIYSVQYVHERVTMKRDDHFRHRLRTAALALREFGDSTDSRNTTRTNFQQLEQHISGDVWSTWKTNFDNNTIELAEHLNHVALEHSPTVFCLQLLTNLTNPDPDVASAAAWTLGWLKAADDVTLEALRTTLLNHTDRLVAWSAAETLGKLKANDADTLKVLRTTLLKHQDPRVARVAAEVLGVLQANDEKTLTALRSALQTHPDPWVARAAAETLGVLEANDVKNVDALRKTMTSLDTHTWVAVEAAETLGVLGANDRVTLEALRTTLLNHPDPDVASAAAEALGVLNATDEFTLEALRIAMLNQTNRWFAGRVAETLGVLGADDSVTLVALRHVVTMTDESSCAAAKALAVLGFLDSETIEALRGMLSRTGDAEWWVGMAAETLGVLQANDEKTLKALRSALQTHSDPDVASAAADALGVLKASDEDSLKALRTTLLTRTNRDHLAGSAAARTLGVLGATDEETLAALRSLLTRSDTNTWKFMVSEAAARTLGALEADDGDTVRCLADCMAWATGRLVDDVVHALVELRPAHPDLELAFRPYADSELWKKFLPAGPLLPMVYPRSDAVDLVFVANSSVEAAISLSHGATPGSLSLFPQRRGLELSNRRLERNAVRFLMAEAAEWPWWCNQDQQTKDELADWFSSVDFHKRQKLLSLSLQGFRIATAG